MAHPMFRPRRLREKPLLRTLVRETVLAVDDLVYPLFAVHGRGVREPIASMPGQFRLSIDELVKEVKDAAGMGIPAVLLFGVPAEKDPRGSEAYAEDGIVQQAVRAVKDVVPDLLIVTDVCLCQYTSHGHCGIVEGGSIRNDPTLELLARVAVSQAEAGADMVAPSDMMDGRVAAIREALDEANLTDTPILAYSAKYASSFYGPFREAADSAPQFGDRRSYQMDPANALEALREIALEHLGERLVGRLAQGRRLADVAALDGPDDAVLERLRLGQNVPQRVDPFADDGQAGERPEQKQGEDEPLLANQVEDGFPGHEWKI